MSRVTVCPPFGIRNVFMALKKGNERYSHPAPLREGAVSHTLLCLASETSLKIPCQLLHSRDLK